MEFFDFLTPKEIIQNIREIIHCPFCDSEYQESYIRIMAKYERSYVLHLFCADCSNSIMASFAYRYNGRPSATDKKIDAKVRELTHFAAKGSISDDDVMNFYKAMKKFNGDFKKLFAEKSRNTNFLK